MFASFLYEEQVGFCCFTHIQRFVLFDYLFKACNLNLEPQDGGRLQFKSALLLDADLTS